MTFSRLLFAIASSLVVSNAFAFSAEQSAQENEVPKTVAEAEKQIKWLDDELQPTDDRSEAEYLLDKVEKTDDGFRLFINYIDGEPYYETGADSLDFDKAIAIGSYKTYFESGVLKSEGYRDTNGERQGVVTVYSKNGHKKREMTYKDGELNGPYRTYASSGYLLTEKTMKDGERNGLMRHYYENGQVRYEAQYKDDVEQGIGKRWDFEGNLMKKSFYEDGVLNGLSTDYYEDGSVKRTQEYKDRKRVGETKLYYKNGELKHYAKRNEDSKVLTSRNYDETGQLTRSREHVETDEHGLVEEKKWYDDSGQLTRLNRQAVDNSWRLSESYDENGDIRDRREFKGYDLHGLYVSRYGNGLEKVRFVEGKRHGSYTITDKDGNITTSGEYDHGKKVGEWVSEDSYGAINEHYNDDGKLDGVREVYGQNGNLRLREHYKNGVLDGTYQEYADNNLVVEGEYVEGKREGEWRLSQGYAPYQMSFGSYKDGTKVGQWRTYSPEGYLRRVESFDSKGYLDGIVVNFTDHGALYNISQYKNDRRHGKSWSYTQSGQPFSISVYENGRLKEERFKDEFETSEFP